MANYVDYDNAVELFTEVGNKRKASESMQESLLKSTVGWTGKNLLLFPFPQLPNKKAGDSITQDGIVWTINSDNSITATGTGTGNGQINLSNRYDDNSCLKLKQGKYIISGCSASLPINIHLGYTKNGAYADVPNSTVTNGSESTFEITDSMLVGGKDYAAIAVYLQCRTQTVNNFTFYPMIRRAGITDPTYEPYHPSVEEEVKQIYADNGVLGAKNLFRNPYYDGTSKTSNGVTFTVNNDGSITVDTNGVASTGEASFRLIRYDRDQDIINTFNEKTLKKSGTDGDVYVQGYWSGATHREDEFIVNASTMTNWNFAVYVASGKTIDNVTIYPMLRLASDPDDTYVPYAMTNRELTEEKLSISELKTIASSAADFAAFKTAIANL